jgi:hypothetical protein
MGPDRSGDGAGYAGRGEFNAPEHLISWGKDTGNISRHHQNACDAWTFFPKERYVGAAYRQ